MSKGCGKYMYNIAFKNGKIINIKADKASWDVENRNVSFFSRKDAHYLVAVFNVDNIAGFIKTDCMTESKDL
jgi:hypothetical protein